MDALVMCGGRGTRLATDVEKPLFEIGDRPMVDRVVDACIDSDLEAVYTAVSPHVPDTNAHLADRSVKRIETPGEGYVADLDRALDAVGTPVLTVTADLPLLQGTLIDRVLAEYEGESLAVYVSAALKELLEISVDRRFERAGRRVVPTGLNVVGTSDQDDIYLSYDARLAVNVNRLSDAHVAERLR